MADPGMFTITLFASVPLPMQLHLGPSRNSDDDIELEEDASEDVEIVGCSYDIFKRFHMRDLTSLQTSQLRKHERETLPSKQILICCSDRTGLQ